MSVCVDSLFASLLKKYTRVTDKIHNLSTASVDSAANHHDDSRLDDSACVVDCVDETDLVR